LSRRAQDRRAHGAHARAPAAARRDHCQTDGRLRGCCRRDRARDSLREGECAHDVAHARHLRRLRRRVHGPSKARHSAEHRYRRRVRCDATGARLGRGGRPGHGGGAAALSHHLRLDAAALLVAGIVSIEGVRKGGSADVAGDARSGVHAAADFALYGRAVRRDAAALRDPHERIALPRRRGCSRRRLRRLRDHYLR